MKKMQRIYPILLSILLVLAGCASRQQMLFDAVTGKTHSALTPVPRTGERILKWWMPRHEAVNARLKQGDADLLFIGNSITHSWENAGRPIWDKVYRSRNAVNMGFSGDRTQHVLWRLDHSDFTGVDPKLAVIMIGTNNSNRNDNTAEEIADGIIAICKRLRERLPRMKILLLAIFPRGHEPSPQRDKNIQASELASKIADNKMIHYLNINDAFLTQEKILTKAIMPDFLHPNEAGYKIWAEQIENKVAELMAED